jgi:hypothetical protein
MRKNDPAFLLKILNLYSSGKLNSLERLADMTGISLRILFVWMRDKEITVDFMGQKQITFGAAMAMARNVGKAATVTKVLEEYVLNGRRVEIYHHGQPVFVEDEALVRLGEDYCRNFLGLPDMLKRDADGNRVIATRIEYPPSQLIEAYARANMPSVYGNKSELTMRGSMSLGVTTVGVRAALPVQQPETITLAPVTETIKLAPVTDTPEVFEAEPADDPVVMAPEPERVIREVPPKEYIAAPTPKPVGVDEIPMRQPRNDLERDLFAKLAEARARSAP